MRFWDSSAIVPLVVRESASASLVALHRADPAMVVWTLTPPEVISALCRRHREGGLGLHQLEAAEDRLHRLRADWAESQDVVAVRQRAERLLHVHALRAADALQLAAALVATEGAPRGFPFVTLDDRLGEAAVREGFRVERLPGVSGAPPASASPRVRSSRTGAGGAAPGSLRRRRTRAR
jgi:hypothetical protein